MIRAFSIRALLVAISVYSFFVFVHPVPAFAWNAASDAQCAGSAQCPVGRGPSKDGPCAGPGGGTIGKFCSDPGSGVQGLCESTIPPKCKAVNAPGLGGSGNALDQGLSQLGSVLGQLMSKLMSGGGQGGGSGSGSGGVNTTPSCTAQPTSDMSIYQSNPTCYYYVPPVSASLGADTTGTGTGSGTSISDQLGSILNTDNTNTNTNTNTNVSDALNNLGSSTQTNTQTSATTSTTTSSAVLVPTNSANLLPGFRGDIQVLTSGATILGGQRDSSSNSETSGFFGVNTLGGAGGTGIVASLCQARPWASGLFSKLIPATFFDGLCSMRGYQVGAPQQVTTTPQVTVTQTKPKPVTSVATTTQTTTVEPKVDIWAVPAKVNLGARTSIFWNTQGVTQCTETSPDGSFSQTSLSGGASTVPITTSTTFTISCLAPDGTHMSDYVTVDLNI